MTILYADDDSEDREIFAEILEEIDPEISLVEASDGRETINILAQGILPDLIFLDINMPRLNGEETLVEIRKDKRFKNTKVVIYSTAVNQKSIESYLTLNAEFLLKPYSVQDGVSKLRYVIEQFSAKVKSFHKGR